MLSKQTIQLTECQKNNKFDAKKIASMQYHENSRQDTHYTLSFTCNRIF
jgi:hypothetical protein